MKAPRTEIALTQSSQLLRLSRRLSAWRERRRPRQPIPEPLWQGAAALARIHGVSAVALALRLNYSDLQRRARWTGGPSKASTAARFVEVRVAHLPPVLASPSTIEWAHPSGSQLTVRLQNTPDLVAVVQSMLRP